MFSLADRCALRTGVSEATTSGCGVAWLTRVAGGHEIGGSNPLILTGAICEQEKEDRRKEAA